MFTFIADYGANLPTTLVIKDVTRNDEYVYSVGVINIDTGVEELFDAVTVDVFCKSQLSVSSIIFRHIQALYSGY